MNKSLLSLIFSFLRSVHKHVFNDMQQKERKERAGVSRAGKTNRKLHEIVETKTKKKES